jgi:hypothetical protein
MGSNSPQQTKATLVFALVVTVVIDVREWSSA